MDVANHPDSPVTIIRRHQVQACTGLSRSAIYAKLRLNPKRPGDYDPTFPHPISLGSRAVGWVKGEVDAWISARVQQSRNAGGAK